jgi:hypothetical protein
MAKYRKKPVVIEAIQYDGNFIPVKEFTELQAYKNGGKDDFVFIPTLEGVMIASTGDWIIKGVNGEFYPCKPDIFEKSYELVE